MFLPWFKTQSGTNTTSVSAAGLPYLGVIGVAIGLTFAALAVWVVVKPNARTLAWTVLLACSVALLAVAVVLISELLGGALPAGLVPDRLRPAVLDLQAGAGAWIGMLGAAATATLAIRAISQTHFGLEADLPEWFPAWRITGSLAPFGFALATLGAMAMPWITGRVGATVISPSGSSMPYVGGIGTASAAGVVALTLFGAFRPGAVISLLVVFVCAVIATSATALLASTVLLGSALPTGLLPEDWPERGIEFGPSIGLWAYAVASSSTAVASALCAPSGTAVPRVAALAEVDRPGSETNMTQPRTHDSDDLR
jgi:hypothetical protein